MGLIQSGPSLGTATSDPGRSLVDRNRLGVMQVAQTKVKRKASGVASKRTKGNRLAEAKKIFPRDPGAEARRLERKKAAKETSR